MPSPLDSGRRLSFLTRVFGKNLGPTDWNGDGTVGNGPWAIQGQECLVFYLGGIPNTFQMANSGAPPTTQGFSTNNMNPALNVALSPQRKGPYFTFDTTRLVPVAARGGFFMYLDPWRAKSVPFSQFLAALPTSTSVPMGSTMDIVLRIVMI